MKIRIKGNTVRYRLSKSEVVTLAEEGRLEEKTEFVGGVLLYTIQQTESGSLSANFTQNTITLYIPEAALQKWANSDAISIDNEVSLHNGASLYLLLEKDFKCIDAGPVEDQSDYFENPNKTC